MKIGSMRETRRVGWRRRHSRALRGEELIRVCVADYSWVAAIRTYSKFFGTHLFWEDFPDFFLPEIKYHENCLPFKRLIYHSDGVIPWVAAGSLYLHW